MLIKDFRLSTKSRSGWMLDLFKASAEKKEIIDAGVAV
jgi:hypothetical protein